MNTRTYYNSIVLTAILCRVLVVKPVKYYAIMWSKFLYMRKECVPKTDCVIT